MDSMRFKNPTNHVISLIPIGLGLVGPDETVDVPLELCAPSRKDNGSRGLSSLEQAAPQLIPVAGPLADVWAKAPPVPEPRSLPVTVSGRAPGVPAGVQALRDAKAIAVKAEAEKKVTK